MTARVSRRRPLFKAAAAVLLRRRPGLPASSAPAQGEESVPLPPDAPPAGLPAQTRAWDGGLKSLHPVNIYCQQQAPPLRLERPTANNQRRAKASAKKVHLILIPFRFTALILSCGTPIHCLHPLWWQMQRKDAGKEQGQETNG